MHRAFALLAIACGPPPDRPEDPELAQDPSQQDYQGVVTYEQTTSLIEIPDVPPIDPVLSGGSMRMESRREIVTVRIAKGRGTSTVSLREHRARHEHIRAMMACTPAEAPHPVTGNSAVEEEQTADGRGEGSVEVSLDPEEGRYEAIVSWTVAAPGKATRQTRGASSGDCDHVDPTPTSTSEEITHEGGSAPALTGPYTANTAKLSGSTTIPVENGESVVTWYLAPKSRCAAESLMVKDQARRLDEHKDKAYQALTQAHQALPSAMTAASQPLPDGSPAPPLTQDFTTVQVMLTELESRYRSGTGKAVAGDLSAEVDPRSRQFVKDLEDNLKDRVGGPLGAIGALARVGGRRLPAVELFLARMRELWEESVRAGSRLEALEQAKQALRDCLAENR